MNFLASLTITSVLFASFLVTTLLRGINAKMPKFIGSLDNVTVSQGRDATFTCTVTNLGGHRVAWIKSDSKAILAIHDHVITNNDRLQVMHNDEDTWMLMIKDVQPKDGGEYMCQVNSIPMVSQVAHLEIVVPPEISDKRSTRDISVPEGGSANFVCSATGHPQPTITWKRVSRDGTENLKIRFKDKVGRTKIEESVTGSSLELNSVSREDMGLYMCIARNNVPPATSKIFKLIVNFKPEIEVLIEVMGAPVGTDVLLQCRIEASPNPITFWNKKSGDMLVPGGKYNITEQVVNSFSYISSLQIRSLEKEDFTGYKCVSKNTIGKSEAMTEIYEIKREPEEKPKDRENLVKLVLFRTEEDAVDKNSGAGHKVGNDHSPEKKGINKTIGTDDQGHRSGSKKDTNALYDPEDNRKRKNNGAKNKSDRSLLETILHPDHSTGLSLSSMCCKPLILGFFSTFLIGFLVK